MQQLGGGGIEKIARSAKVNSGDVSNVLAGAVPAVLAGLSRNTQSTSGAGTLLNALDRDHDGSVLDDVLGFLGGDSDTAGTGILGHVFGSRQTNVEKAVSHSSGVDQSAVTRIMAIAAPLIMGNLGKARREQNLDASGLAATLSRQEQITRERAPAAADMFSRLLDRDGDGDTMDDIVKMGSGLLGKLFSK